MSPELEARVLATLLISLLIHFSRETCTSPNSLESWNETKTDLLSIGKGREGFQDPDMAHRWLRSISARRPR